MIRPIASRRTRRRCAIRRACWPPAAICAPSGCWPPIERGIFPWYSPGPAGAVVVARSARSAAAAASFIARAACARALRTRGFMAAQDRDFAAVVAACAAPRARSPGTWITAEMQAAYCALHQRGLAHSYEIWRAERLVGGVYGVRLGRVFFGESMFSREPDASKAALAGLVEHCAAQGIELIDCQLPSAHLRSLGSRAMPRRAVPALPAACLGVGCPSRIALAGPFVRKFAPLR